VILGFSGILLCLLWNDITAVLSTFITRLFLLNQHSNSVMLQFFHFSTEHLLIISLLMLEVLCMFQGIKSLIEDFVKRNQPILFYNLKPSIVEIFQGVQPKDFKYCRNEVELNELLKGKQRRATVA
jgi:hypothetical protein